MWIYFRFILTLFQWNLKALLLYWYFLSPLFVLSLLYILFLYLLQIQQCTVIIIALFNIMTFKEGERRKKSKYIFMEFVILIFLFTLWFSWFLTVDLNYHLMSFSYFSVTFSTPALLVMLLSNITFLSYRPNNVITYIGFMLLILTSVKKDTIILAFVIIDIITFTGTLFFVCVDLNYCLASLSTWRISFSVSCKAGILEANYLNFCLSGSIFFTLILKCSFAKYEILGWQFFTASSIVEPL